MAREKAKVVNVVIGDRGWQMSLKMAQTIIKVGREQYEKQNVNAIVAVQKDNVISLMKDTFEDTSKFISEIVRWEKGGYKCFYTTKKEEEK